MKSCFITCGNFDKLEAKLYPNFTKSESEIEKMLINLIDINPYTIDSVETSQVEKHPFPPFITSTLQQEAAVKLKMSAFVTMQTAQKLYEKGYITYMRTDSCNLSKDASFTIKEFINKDFGSKYYKYRTFTNKDSSQEAHECIRPTYINTQVLEPELQNAPALQKLYDLIWCRTIASQMASAIYDCQNIKIINSHQSFKNKYFKTTNKKLFFDGFLKVYQIDNVDTDVCGTNNFVDIKKGESITLSSLHCTETFDYTNSRYSEPTLIRKLEQLGIGRPSTYVSILNTIQQRSYVQVANVDGVEKEILDIVVDSKKNLKKKKKKIKIGIDKKKFVPTDTGLKVNSFLEDHFANLINYNYTAELEKKLDVIAEGKLNFQNVLNELYKILKPNVDKLSSKISISESSQSKSKINLGEDSEGTKYCVLKSKNGWVIKKDFKETKSSLFFAITDVADPTTLTLQEAIDRAVDGKLLGIYRGKEIFVLRGKYGPYIKYGNKNINLKGNDKITFEIAKKLV